MGETVNRLQEARQERTMRQYRYLRNLRPDLYRQAAQQATTIGLNFSLEQNVTAEIEGALVSMALEALGKGFDHLDDT